MWLCRPHSTGLAEERSRSGAREQGCRAWPAQQARPGRQPWRCPSHWQANRTGCCGVGFKAPWPGCSCPSAQAGARSVRVRAGGRALLDTPSRLPLTAGGDGMARHAALTGTTPSPRPACRLANLTASLPAARRASSLPPVFGSAFVSGSAPPGICVSAASAGFGCHRSSAATPLARPRLLRSRLLLRLRCERLCGRPALRAASSLRPSSGWAYAQRQQVGVEQHAAVELAG